MQYASLVWLMGMNTPGQLMSDHHR